MAVHDEALVEVRQGQDDAGLRQSGLLFSGFSESRRTQTNLALPDVYKIYKAYIYIYIKVCVTDGRELPDVYIYI